MAAAVRGGGSGISSSIGQQAGERKSKDLFVGNLAPSCSEKDLILLFKAHGTVEKVEYMWHKSGPSRGQPKGFAFVEFANVTQAIAALKALDGTMVRGRRLAVRYSARDSTSQTGQSALQQETGKRGREEEAASDTSKRTSASSSSSSICSIEARIRKLKEALKGPTDKA